MSSPLVFLGLTLILMGATAFATGAAIARTWRPWGQVVGYGLLLGLADRFLAFALFQESLLSAVGYLADTALLIALGLAAWRITRARQMCVQYPWLYERTGLFTWGTKMGG
ncbi:MAG: hypothetical protein HZC25_16750 [Rhodospirillales bacterium]|nr:hypothetical protein [Rhodospirillales bacterium]